MTATLTPHWVRLAGLDRLRGLAVALMVLDHLLLVSHEGQLLRHTLTRAALPLFFVVSGLLLTARPRWSRLAVVSAAGVLVGLAVPWVGSPNVLVLWALSALVLTGPRWLWWAAMITAATFLANGYTLVWDDSYPWPALVLLLGLGQDLRRQGWLWLFDRAGSQLPAFVGVLGRYPVSLYVLHLLFLQGCLVIVEGVFGRG